MSEQIVWKDLPKRYALFTKCNTAMVNVATGAKVMCYSENTKINVVQETTYNEVRYFRTESAKEKGLDLAIKASTFDLPPDLASLEPSKKPLNDKFSSYNKFSHSTKPNKKPSKTQKTPKSEEVISEERKHSILSAFKRFFRRKK